MLASGKTGDETQGRFMGDEMRAGFRPSWHFFLSNGLLWGSIRWSLTFLRMWIGLGFGDIGRSRILYSIQRHLRQMPWFPCLRVGLQPEAEVEVLR